MWVTCALSLEFPGLAGQYQVMQHNSPRLAARAIIVVQERLLLVNAYRGSAGSGLWCAPGGGVERGQDLHRNVAREVFEETGLEVSVGDLALVNEFHDPRTGFHQVELFFRCGAGTDQIDPKWIDPEAVVTDRRFFTRGELATLHLRPCSLPDVAFEATASAHYDLLEEIVF